MRPVLKTSSRTDISNDVIIEEESPEVDVMKPLTTDIGAYAYEDWFGSEVIIPRDTDRILEQIVLMLLRIGAYLKNEGKESITASQILKSAIPASWPQLQNIDCAAMNGDETDTPPHVGSSKGNIASYLREYPQIFMKKQGNGLSQTELTFATLKTGQSHNETNEGVTSINAVKQYSPSSTSNEEISLAAVEKVSSKKKITISESNTAAEDNNAKIILPLELQTDQTSTAKEKILKSKLKKQRAESVKYASEIINKVLYDFQESNTSADDDQKASTSYASSNIINKVSKETMNDDNLKNMTNFATINTKNSKTVTENLTPKENNNDEFSFGKTETVEKSSIQNIPGKNASDITILNEVNKHESALSEILNVENNDHCAPNVIENVIESYDDKVSFKASDEMKLIENNNNNENFSYGSKILEKGNSREIPIVDNNKGFTDAQISNGNEIESTGVQLSKDDSNSNISYTVKEINNKFINLSSNKEFSQKKDTTISKDNKNKELPLRILSNDDNSTDTLGVKVPDED